MSDLGALLRVCMKEPPSYTVGFELSLPCANPECYTDCSDSRRPRRTLGRIWFRNKPVEVGGGRGENGVNQAGCPGQNLLEPRKSKPVTPRSVT